MKTLVTHKYLNLPVKDGAPKRLLRLAVNGRPFDAFEIELAPAQPDFWVFVDLSGHLGEPLELSLDGEGEASAARCSTTRSRWSIPTSSRWSSSSRT